MELKVKAKEQLQNIGKYCDSGGIDDGPNGD